MSVIEKIKSYFNKSKNSNVSGMKPFVIQDGKTYLNGEMIQSAHLAKWKAMHQRNVRNAVKK
ncbi:TPA: hypothetical protein RFW04_000736 [Klebsiella variicola]|nr:hypothetical protein [Klebsiella variicola]